MDLFDVLKACLRWAILVAAIVAIGAWQAGTLAETVDVKYEVSNELLFVGPSTDLVYSADDTALVEETKNPFLQFSGSLEITSSALVRIVDGAEYRRLIEAEGFTGDYEIGAAPGAPSIIVVAEALSPESATALAVRAGNAVAEEMNRLQNEADVPAIRRIGLQQLTLSDAEELAGDRLVVFGGVIAISIAAAVALAVGLDTLMTLRRRRRMLAGKPARSTGAMGPRRGRLATRNRPLPSLPADTESPERSTSRAEIPARTNAGSAGTGSEHPEEVAGMGPNGEDAGEADHQIDADERTEAADESIWRTGPISSQV